VNWTLTFRRHSANRSRFPVSLFRRFGRQAQARKRASQDPSSWASRLESGRPRYLRLGRSGFLFVPFLPAALARFSSRSEKDSVFSAS
jgi:hypothetical protein